MKHPVSRAQGSVTFPAKFMLVGLKLSLTDDAAALASIDKYTRVDEPDLLRETLDYFRRIARREPYPVPAGLQTLLDLEADRNPRAR